MREFTKSMMSYTWAMSMFGVQQMLNLLTPGQGRDQTAKAAKAFNNVTDATTQTFDKTLKEAFDTGDKMQKGMVDMMLGGSMGGGCDPSRWMQMGTDAMQRMTSMGMRAAQSAGCGGCGGAQSPPPPGGPAAQGPAAPPPSGGGWGPMPR